jgi:hypothetical protein
MTGITAQERKLAETLRDPVLWGYAYLFNRDGSARGYWEHQVDDLLNWNAEREAELLEFYGGRDSAGWQHEVVGEHGKPSYGAFNLAVTKRPAARKMITRFVKEASRGGWITSWFVLRVSGRVIHRFFRKKAVPFKHCQNHQAVRKYLVDDAVIPLDQFADIVTGKFGHLAAGKRSMERTTSALS